MNSHPDIGDYLYDLTPVNGFRYPFVQEYL